MAGQTATTQAKLAEYGRTHPLRRRLPVGAEVQAGRGTHFRVWAPKRHKVEVLWESGSPRGCKLEPLQLMPEEHGYYSGLAPEAGAGVLYRFRLDGGEAYPDPAARFQPRGPHGPSQIVDPHAFAWSCAGWCGVALRGQVFYEMHIGTFTPAGTWEAATAQLPHLSDLGITVLEVMPVAEFPGRFGWGYDGVCPFATYHGYGTPDDFRRFVDRAHTFGMGVVLDVVYNHLGPDGCYLKQYADDYFTDRYQTDWGAALNFDGPGAEPVRDFFLANAAYWMDEFHLDGLRLDATQNIYDSSPEHFLAALARRVRQASAGRRTVLIAENEPQHTWLVQPAEQGGYGLDGLWNDDFHHTALVALTGRHEAYYCDYRGSPQEFISAAKWGYLYQGQRYLWQKKQRGTPSFGLPPEVFVNFLENHDQLANSAAGRRVYSLTSPARYRALTALLLLAPGTPLLFQGQEFAASSPFVFFADHQPELARVVRAGRARFLAQFPSMATAEVQARLLDPADPGTFQRCKLDPAEREAHAEARELHRDLLRLRREDAVFAAQRPQGVDGAVLGPEAFLLRYFGADGDDRLLLVNLGKDQRLGPAPEPLFAPRLHRAWTVLWSSADPRYGGLGTPPLPGEDGWLLPGESAVVLAPRVLTEAERQAERERFGPDRSNAVDACASVAARPSIPAE
jgi:maltooligosyltrehalose trehalohydrolase